MKITLTLKSWTLLTGAFIIIVMGIFYYLIPSILFNKGDYEAIAKHYAYSPYESDALVKLILAADPLGDDSIYIDPQGYGGASPSVESKQSIENVKSYIQRMMQDYPEHVWTRNNSEYSLAQMYRKENNWGEALQLYEKVAAGDTHHQEQAMQWVNILKQPNETNQSPSLTGKVWLDDQPASQVYVYVREKETNSWHSNPIGTYPTTVTNEQGEYTFYTVAPEDYYVGIGMAPERLEGYVRAEERINDVTIKAGETAAFDVRFTKQMNVNYPKNGENIKGDSISFSWDPYPGTETYRMTIVDVAVTDEGDIQGFGGSMQLHESWKTPEAEYNIEQLRETYFGTFASKDSGGLSPASVLGMVYPGGQFTWSVDAYDQHGTKLSSSKGVYTDANKNIPVFSLDQKGQLKGDVHVIKQDFDKAIEAYENEIEHPYALRALSMIYRTGPYFNDQGNHVRSLEYMKKIEKPTERDLQIIEMLKKELERS